MTDIRNLRSIAILTILLVFAGSLWQSWSASAQGGHSVGDNIPASSTRVENAGNRSLTNAASPVPSNSRALMSDLNLSTGDKVHWADGSYISGGETLNKMTFSAYTGFNFFSTQINQTVLSTDNTQLYFNLPFNIGRGYINSTDGSFGNPSTNLFQANMYGGNFTFYDTQHSANSMTIAAGSVQTYNNTSNVVAFTVNGAASQSAHLFDVKNSSGTVLDTIDSSGNVGIGTSSPSSKLSVVGNVAVTGNITATGTVNATYQDVAEWVPSSEALSGGTVVILDPLKRNNVIASNKSYDTSVAGVVSERPGVLLGEGGAGKAIVATTGRVMVKVNATRKAIAVGDLLVTSDLSGYAMASEPVNFGGIEMHRPGTLIGKALEPLAKGKKGEILVLLSLQ